MINAGKVRKLQEKIAYYTEELKALHKQVTSEGNLDDKQQIKKAKKLMKIVKRTRQQLVNYVSAGKGTT